MAKVTITLDDDADGGCTLLVTYDPPIKQGQEAATSHLAADVMLGELERVVGHACVTFSSVGKA